MDKEHQLLAVHEGCKCLLSDREMERDRVKSILTAAVADIMEITSLHEDCPGLREHIRGIISVDTSSGWTTLSRLPVPHVIWVISRLSREMADRPASIISSECQAPRLPGQSLSWMIHKGPSPLPMPNCKVSFPAVLQAPPCPHKGWHSDSL